MHSFMEILVKTSTCNNHQGLRILIIRDIGQALVYYLWTMVTTVQSSLDFRPWILAKSTHTTPTLSPHTGLPPSTLPKPIPFPSLSHVLPPPGPRPPTAQLKRTVRGHLVQLDANKRPQVLASTYDELGPSIRWSIASRRVRGDGGPTCV
jgi:hypothetical protein